MTKFPYVLDYKLFERVDLSVASDLLDEYKDFYEYNKMQVSQMNIEFETFDDDNGDEVDSLELAKRADHNKSVSIDHFEKNFGSKDFAEACLVGMKIDFYELQKILMAEHRRGLPITESALNAIAPKLRVLASILLFAERITKELNKHVDKGGVNGEKAAVAFKVVKEGFEILLQRHADKEVSIPEFNRSKKELAKIKTVEKYLEFCEKLFFNENE